MIPDRNVRSYCRLRGHDEDKVTIRLTLAQCHLIGLEGSRHYPLIGRDGQCQFVSVDSREMSE